MKRPRLAVLPGIGIALLVAACGSGSSGSPTRTLASGPAASSVGSPRGTSASMALPWPDGVAHPWTGGPHGLLDGDLCVPPAVCAANVPPANRSGLDFGAGAADWAVYAAGRGTLLYKGALTGGFGAGAIVDQDGLDVIYAHMDQGSLADAPAAGSRVDHSTKLGMTSCTGMSGCPADRSTHHLHLELRTGTQASAAGIVSYGTPLSWNGRTIGSWTIHADSLNYNGWATNSCGTRIVADAASGPAMSAATSCATPTPKPAKAPTPTKAPTKEPTPTPKPTPTPTPKPTAKPSKPAALHERSMEHAGQRSELQRPIQRQPLLRGHSHLELERHVRRDVARVPDPAGVGRVRSRRMRGRAASTFRLRPDSSDPVRVGPGRQSPA
jgi:hypothetical protein